MGGEGEPVKGLKPTLIIAIGLLAGSAVGAAAQDEEAAVGPPGSAFQWGGALFIEKPNEQDEDSTKTGPLFKYNVDATGRGAFLFVSDEDWCRHALLVQLEVDAPEKLAACLEWVETSPFSADNLVLPETWAVRIAKRAGWYGDEGE
jgi:hypothetical protein